MRYRAAIFDLDGTLVDSLADLADSVNEALAAYGYPQHDLAAYRYFVGNGARLLLRRALPEGAGESLVDEALAKYKAIYARRMLIKTRPYAGVTELLAALQARGLRLAVCTNKHHEAALEVTGALFPAGTFAAVLGDDGLRARKPDPAAVLDILASLGVAPQEALYLGDSEVDMRTAVAAGALPIGVLWGFRPREELEAAGGRVFLSHPRELLEKVELQE